MAVETITYPDAIAADLRDALCWYGEWDAGSGLTKAAFAREVHRDWLAMIYRNYLGTQAEKSGGDTARAQADSSSATMTVT